jgi:hypothetical protein
MELGKPKTRDIILNISFDVYEILNNYISKPLYNTTIQLIYTTIDNNVNVLNTRTKLNNKIKLI